jgi:hypothetical protein
MGHFQTHAPQQNDCALARLFDHPVGTGKQHRWHVKAERLRRLEIDNEIVPCGACIVLRRGCSGALITPVPKISRLGLLQQAGGEHHSRRIRLGGSRMAVADEHLIEAEPIQQQRLLGVLGQVFVHRAPVGCSGIMNSPRGKGLSRFCCRMKSNSRVSRVYCTHPSDFP